MPNQSHNIWQGVQIKKLLTKQVSPLTCYFHSLRSKYSSLYPVLRHAHCMSSLDVGDQNKGQYYSFIYFSLLCVWVADRKKILDHPDRQHSWNLICFWFHHECISYLYHYQIYETCHILNGLQAVFMVWVYPALCSWDINVYFVFFASDEYLVIFTFEVSSSSFDLKCTILCYVES